MFELAGTMLGVAGAWAAMYVVFLGWGQFWRIYPGGAGLTNARLWVGFALAIVVLQVWHLVLPVDWRATVAVTAVGVAGWGWRLKRLSGKAGVSEGLWTALSRHKLFAGLSALIVLWTANHCLLAPTNGDSAIYHFPSILWLNEYPIVPGLGNLQGRLAFNQSYFLFPAVLNAAPYFQKGYHLANGFLLTVLAVQLLYRTMAPGGLSLRLFAAFMLVIMLRRATIDGLSNPTPDLAIFVLGTLLMLWLLECLTQTRTSPENVPACGACLVVVAVLGVTFKLSFLGFAATLVVLCLWLSVRAASGPFRNRLAPAVLGTALLTAGMGGAWVARGVASSGYPVYPSTWAGMPLDWKIPARNVAMMRATIFSFGRTDIGRWTETTVNKDWLKPWLARIFSRELKNPLMVMAVATIALVALRLRRPMTFGSELWLPLIPLAGWLVFWFVTAPDPRFARAAFWLLAGWLGASAATHLADIRGWKSQRIMQSFLILGLAAIVPGSVRKGTIVTDLATSGFGVMPQAPVKEYYTASGLKLFVPMVEEQLWNAPLPSTPYPDPSLKLRGKTLAEGFRCSGDQ